MYHVYVDYTYTFEEFQKVRSTKKNSINVKLLLMTRGEVFRLKFILYNILKNIL